MNIRYSGTRGYRRLTVVGQKTTFYRDAAKSLGCVLGAGLRKGKLPQAMTELFKKRSIVYFIYGDDLNI